MNAEWRESNPELIEMAVLRDTRLVRAPPSDKCSMVAFFGWTKAVLRKVAARGVSVESLIQMENPAHGTRILLCGERKGAQFVRNDGMCCNFTITVDEQGVRRNRVLTVCSYALHLSAPDGHTPPSFLRWEFQQNRKAGVDAIKEPLAHLHPGHDAVRVPAPVLSPKELILLILGTELW